MTTLTFHKMPPYKPEEIEENIARLGIQLDIIEAFDLENSARLFQHHIHSDEEWMKYYSGIEHEKWMEHFLSYHLLNPADGMVVLDVASHWSPYQRILKKLNKVTVYLQDQCFEEGIHDNMIGSDCSHIPLPANSVDLIAVNNSIEHFEGGKDTLFIKEAYRLLRPGGRMCIVPLFINTVIVNLADPSIDLSDVPFDAGALLVSSAPWKLRFSRVYTPDTYLARLVRAVPEFHHRIVSIRNMDRFDSRLNYWSFAALVTKS